MRVDFFFLIRKREEAVGVGQLESYIRLLPTLSNAKQQSFSVAGIMYVCIGRYIISSRTKNCAHAISVREHIIITQMNTHAHVVGIIYTQS